MTIASSHGPRMLTTAQVIVDSPRATRAEWHLTTRYIVALSMIAVLAILGYGIERIRRPRASDAQLIVIAARQRMLGQQITKAALASASATTSVQRDHYLKELEDSRSMLQDSHELLRFGDAQQAVPVEDDPETLKIFDGIERHLEALLAEAHMLASTVREAPLATPHEFEDPRARLLAAETQFMASANDLVRRYADTASAHVRSSDRIQLALTVALLGVLLLQGVFVFAPAVRKVRDAITTLEDTQAKLASLAAIVESSGDAIAGTSLAGDVHSWNRGAEAMFGRTAADMIGKNISTIIRPQSADAVQESLARVATGDAVTPFDAVAAGANDRRIDISLMMSPISSTSGAVASLAIIGRDITDRVQAQKMKSDFVSFVSHQLRTPLAGIKWMLELTAESPDLSTAAGEYVADARASADRLIHLVNDLLDVSRLEEGRLTVALQTVQLDEVTRSLIAELDGLVQQKSIAFAYRTQSDVPPVVVDPQLMRQALGNLISNAIKYTPAGGHITLVLERDNGSVRWGIQDSGIGIPAASQARLFEKFFRADNALVIETEGTGLGLYLVRLIVTQFGGRISCESEEGHGATFVVTLPVLEVAA